MKKITGTIKAWLTEYSSPQQLLDDDGNIGISSAVYSHMDMSTSGWTYVGDATITINVISENEIIGNKVDSLKKSIVQEQAQSQMRINDLQNKINDLLAITYQPESEGE